MQKNKQSKLSIGLLPDECSTDATQEYHTANDEEGPVFAFIYDSLRCLMETMEILI